MLRWSVRCVTQKTAHFRHLKFQGVYEGQDYLPSVYNTWIIEEETQKPFRWLSVQIPTWSTILSQVQLCGGAEWKCRWFFLSALHQVEKHPISRRWICNNGWNEVVAFRDRSTFILSATRVARWTDLADLWVLGLILKGAPGSRDWRRHLQICSNICEGATGSFPFFSKTYF